MVALNPMQRPRPLSTPKPSSEQATSTARKLTDRVTETMEDALLLLDEKWRITQANEAFCRGFATSPVDAIGRSLFDVANAQFDADELKPALEKVLADNEALTGFVVNQECDKASTRTLSLNARRLIGAPGASKHVLLTITDTSTAAGSTEALAESEQRFRDMVEALPAAIFTSDADGKIAHFNTALVSLAHATPRLGQDQWSDVFTLRREDGALVGHNEKNLAAALSEGPAHHSSEHVLERRDGSRIWCEIYSSPRYDAQGGLLGGVNMLVDVTEKRAAAAALRARDERDRALFDSAPMGLFVCDRNGVIESFNQQAANLWGRRPRPGVDLYKDLVQLRDARGQRVPCEKTPLATALSTGQSLECVGHSIERPDGSLLPVFGRISTFKGRDGEVTGAIVSFIDVSDQKRVEQELRDADRHKDEFIAMLAHELRNPLAPMQNALELLRPIIDALPQPPDGSKNTGRRAMEMLDAQMNQMVRLVDDLLDVNRMTTGRIELRRERVDLCSVVSNVAQGLAWKCEAENQKLTMTIPSTAHFVDADPARLSQVFSNLIHNAIKFSDIGRIDVSVQAEAGDVVVRVSDTGIGIAANELERIFQLFAQIDASRRRSAGGLGIGLALVRNLVELHGGSVSARSDGPGRGSEFVVRLPQIDEPGQETQTRAPGHAAPTPSSPTSAKRVLVVDDNEDAAESLALLLQTKGYDTRAAFDGFQGLAAVAEFDPDVVFLDIGMPVLDGLEVARRLRAQYPDRGLRLVALTGWGLPDDHRRSAQAGFDAHMVKPVAFDTLHAWLKANV